jgi:MFS family permease
MFGGIMLLPLYMQIVHGATPTQSGFLMLPMVAGLMTASVTSGRIISRTGRTRTFPIVGSALMAVGMFALTTISADTHLWMVMLMMLVVGYGVGNCMQPLVLTVQSSVPPTSIGVATSAATFFRQIGGTIGVAVFLSMLFGGVGADITHAFAMPSRRSRRSRTTRRSIPRRSTAGSWPAIVRSSPRCRTTPRSSSR